MADLLKRLPEGTTVQEVVDNARCGLCRAKAKSDFRILYVGASMDAMIGGRQDNPSQK